MALFGKLKYFTIVTGQTKNAHMELIKILRTGKPNLQTVSTVEECDVILVFCPVVSRAGTDIEAAQQKLIYASVTKPAVLVVLHHLLKPENIPDSSRCVTRKNTLTVDCVFHEDRGLLECSENERATDKIKQFLKQQKPASASKLRDYGTLSSQPSTQSLTEPLLERNAEDLDNGSCSWCCCSWSCCS